MAERHDEAIGKYKNATKTLIFVLFKTTEIMRHQLVIVSLLVFICLQDIILIAITTVYVEYHRTQS